jgi:carbon monoxide dehydrogenase subunit G
MILENEFGVNLSKRMAIDVLTDVPLIAPCIPGVAITEITGDRYYKGEATVRLGPVKITFTGVGEITEINYDNYIARVKARGSDKKGRGGADATVSFELQDGPVTEAGFKTTKVIVRTDLSLNGSIAQYGRASGLIEGIAQELTKEFAENLKKVLSTDDDDTFDAKEISGLKLLVKAGIGKFKIGGKKTKDETGSV